MINTKFKIGDEITLPEALKYQVKEILRVVAVEKFQDGWGYEGRCARPAPGSGNGCQQRSPQG